MRRLPPRTVLPRQPHARSEGRALRQRGPRRPDQVIHAARYQGQPAVSARRPTADARRHRRVLQFVAEPEAHPAREEGPGCVSAAALGRWNRILSLVTARKLRIELRRVSSNRFLCVSRTSEGWLYLAAVLDAYSRTQVGRL